MSLFDSFRKKKLEEKRSKEKPDERIIEPISDKLKAQELIKKAGNWQVGDRIENRYEIHQILGGPGKSGMGIVYICYDHQEHLPVAIKTFQEKFLLDQKARDNFNKEALTWIKLDRHKNIVKAYYVENIEYRRLWDIIRRGTGSISYARGYHMLLLC